MKTKMMAIVLGTMIATPAAAQFGGPPRPGDMGPGERPGTFDPNRRTERDSYDYSNASAQVRGIAGRIERAVQYGKISDREAESLHRDLREIVRMEAKAASNDPGSDEQKALNRFELPVNNRLNNVREWLDEREVVSDDTRTSTWLAFGFLLVCLVNTVGLLLAKFSARPGEIGVRRALGASRGEVFRQYLTEAAVIGLVGAGTGIALTLGALAFIRDFNPGIAQLTHLDVPMLAIAVVVSVLAAIVAGLLPTWRACQVVPALQLKSQ